MNQEPPNPLKMNPPVPPTQPARRTSLAGSDRTLRRINVAIWSFVAGCFLLAAVIWKVLLHELP